MTKQRFKNKFKKMDNEVLTLRVLRGEMNKVDATLAAHEVVKRINAGKNPFRSFTMEEYAGFLGVANA